jgi:hypothetical protein
MPEEFPVTVLQLPDPKDVSHIEYWYHAGIPLEFISVNYVIKLKVQLKTRFQILKECS